MKRRLFLLLSFLVVWVGLAWSQGKTVKGVVTSSEDGLPIVGASVLVKGTTVGMISDIDGKFELGNIPESAKLLVVSYVGMQPKEVKISSGVMNIVLSPDVEVLDEVVVTAQGLTRQEKSLGYSTQKVKAEDLSITRQTDLNNALVGKVSGVRFMGSSGATFDGGSVVLRGTSSLTNAKGGSPIYVIDGIIADDANSINMDDVESVNVLKGPAATALYGSRGGNGAIIITSKGGSAMEGTTQIDVSHTFAWEKMYDHFDMQNQYGGGYMGAEAELPIFHFDASKHPAYLKALDGKAYYDYNNDASWGPALNGQQYLPAYAWDPNDPRFGQTTAWSPQMDLADLFRTGISNTTNVSFAKTGKNHATRVSFSNVSRQGITPNSDASRRYLSVKTQFKPWERLKISLDYKYTYRKNHNAAVEGYQELGNALYSYQQWGHTNVNLKDYENYKRTDGSHIFWNILSRDSYPESLDAAFHDNPYAIFNEVNTTDIYQWNLFSGDAELTIWKNLKAGIRVNGNIRSEKWEQTVPNGMFGQVSSYKQNQTSFSDIQTQGRVTWGDRFINDKLTVDAAVFFEDRQNSEDLLKGFTRNGLIMNGFENLGGSVGDAGGSNTKIKIHEQSVYGTVTAGWNDTYYIDASLRNDWSSVLHPDNNSYLYGGVSVAAIASNWFKGKAEWLNFWKIRASAAQVGSTMDPYNVYNAYSIRNSAGDIVKYNGLSTMWTSPNLRDPYIKPTISTSYEIGTEFRMFNNRFWGDFNFYNRDSKNQIVDMNTTPASGYTTRKMNAGLIRNRGVELSLGGEIIRTKNWSWEVNANISHNRNTLEELAEGQESYMLFWQAFSTRVYSYAEVGQPIGVIRGSAWKRNPEGKVILTQDKSGDYVPMMETTAQKELGNIQPDLTGGFSTTLRYKGFTFGASLDFQVGGALASATNMFGEMSGLLSSTTGLNDKGNPIRNSVENGGGVRLDGVIENPDGSFTQKTTYLDAQKYYQSYKGNLWEDYVYDASYVKLRELSLGYTVPTSFLKRLNWGVEKASISFVAQNPWLIYSAVPNIDPSEMGAATQGYIEGGQAASVRSYGFTVNLTF